MATTTPQDPKDAGAPADIRCLAPEVKGTPPSPEVAVAGR